MTNIAGTAAFFPHDKSALRQQLVEWNLAEEIDFTEKPKVVRKGACGTTPWPR